jgi:hypothetical protein
LWPILIERFSLTSAKPFDEILAVIYNAIGHPEMMEFWKSTYQARERWPSCKLQLSGLQTACNTSSSSVT